MDHTLPTDQELAEVAEEETAFFMLSCVQKGLSAEKATGAGVGFERAHLAALKVEKECYRLLTALMCHEDCQSHYFDRTGLKEGEPANFGPCTCGRQTHLIVLRSRLGINK